MIFLYYYYPVRLNNSCKEEKMTLVNWKPMRDFDSMFDRMTRLLYNGYRQEMEDKDQYMADWSPVTDIYETKEDYVFKVEVPGMNKDDIKIEVKDDSLWISGERKEDMEVKKDDYHRVESRIGKFSRSFRLPSGIDQDKIKASMKNGILELQVPKPETKKPKSISIG